VQSGGQHQILKDNFTDGVSLWMQAKGSWKNAYNYMGHITCLADLDSSLCPCILCKNNSEAAPERLYPLAESAVKELVLLLIVWHAILEWP